MNQTSRNWHSGTWELGTVSRTLGVLTSLVGISLPARGKQHPGQRAAAMRERLYLSEPSLNGSFDKGSLTWVREGVGQEGRASYFGGPFI